MAKKMMERTWILVLLLVVFWVFSADMVRADNITDSIEEALENYKNGNLAEAMNSLDYAAQLVRQKRGGNLQSLLPDPLDGWTAKDASSEAAGAAMFGGAVTAEREYQKEPSNITIKIVTDSPMLQGIMMMFSNPAIAVSQGGELQKIKGRKAIVKYDKSNGNGDIRIVVANRFLVTVEGQEVTQQDLIDYASAIPFEKLESF
ncbi:MAG: hypothetical protein AB2L11_09295 [Syntrophobacteraceae bacterium]